jgi:alcohol dehydrogenase class IV
LAFIQPFLLEILQTDVVKRVEKVLKDRDAYGATFYEIGEHSPIANIKKGVKAFKDSGADVIVSIGGGSPIDSSKVIIHTIQKESKDSGEAFKKQIAIPTTLSAAEYTVSCL